MNLTIDMVERVRSFTLAKSLLGVLKKIRDAQKSVFVRCHESFGFARAVEVVSLAIKLGCISAGEWLSDDGFSRWLTLHDMYSPYGVNRK